MALIPITKNNFDAEVLHSGKTVLLDFYADWCGPCKMLAPILAEVAAERPDITVGKINVDNDMELAIRFGVTSIPLLVVMENGQMVGKSLGYCPKEEVLELLP
ncbi:MAG: thioredoxin [Ruminococcaceae bacterium]|nr:thioredoxin [Oscillospiraceae bacterium]